MACLVALSAPTQAQERLLTLSAALEEARRGNLTVQVARARARGAREAAQVAGSFRWPSVGLEAGAIRSNDPVAAFGGRLRQGRFAQEDFDPARLNDPDPLTDWSGAVGAVWTPVDLSANAGYQAALREADAAELGSAWAGRATAFQVEARYLEAVGAEGRLRASEAALEAALENERLVERRRDEGVLTDADAMQARAAAAGARARHIDAERALTDARERLAVALGWPEGLVPVPTDSVFEAPRTADGGPVGARADLRASEMAIAVSEARQRQAGRARLPALSGFARLETHSMDAFSGARRDWTVGVQLRVPLFTSFAITAREAAATAAREAAERAHQLRLREAQAELQQARRALSAAEQGLAAAETGADAAAEAARLMRRRFEEGLVTTADLLAVEAQAAAHRVDAVDARLNLHLAAATVAFLTDTDDDIPGGWDR